MTNEGEGASIAAGVWLTGKRAALIMENSGPSGGDGIALPPGSDPRDSRCHADELSGGRGRGSMVCHPGTG